MEKTGEPIPVITNPFKGKPPCATVLHTAIFKVDFELVWKTIHEDLPELYALIGQLSTPQSAQQ